MSHQLFGCYAINGYFFLTIDESAIMEVIFEQHSVDHPTSTFTEFMHLNQGGNDELQTIKQKLEYDLQNLTNTLKEQAEQSLINVQQLVKSNKQHSEKINELQRENEKLRSDNSLLSVKLQAAEHLLDKTNQEYYKYEADNKILNEKLGKSKEKSKKLKESLLHTETQMQEVHSFLCIINIGSYIANFKMPNRPLLHAMLTSRF